MGSSHHRRGRSRDGSVRSRSVRKARRGMTAQSGRSVKSFGTTKAQRSNKLQKRQQGKEEMPLLVLYFSRFLDAVHRFDGREMLSIFSGCADDATKWTKDNIPLDGLEAPCRSACVDRKARKGHPIQLPHWVPDIIMHVKGEDDVSIDMTWDGSYMMEYSTDLIDIDRSGKRIYRRRRNPARSPSAKKKLESETAQLPKSPTRNQGIEDDTNDAPNSFLNRKVPSSPMKKRQPTPERGRSPRKGIFGFKSPERGRSPVSKVQPPEHSMRATKVLSPSTSVRSHRSNVPSVSGPSTTSARGRSPASRVKSPQHSTRGTKVLSPTTSVRSHRSNAPSVSGPPTTSARGRSPASRVKSAQHSTRGTKVLSPTTSVRSHRSNAPSASGRSASPRRRSSSKARSLSRERARSPAIDVDGRSPRSKNARSRSKSGGRSHSAGRGTSPASRSVSRRQSQSKPRSPSTDRRRSHVNVAGHPSSRRSQSPSRSRSPASSRRRSPSGSRHSGPRLSGRPEGSRRLNDPQSSEHARSALNPAALSAHRRPESPADIRRAPRSQSGAATSSHADKETRDPPPASTSALPASTIDLKAALSDDSDVILSPHRIKSASKSFFKQLESKKSPPAVVAEPSSEQNKKEPTAGTKAVAESTPPNKSEKETKAPTTKVTDSTPSKEDEQETATATTKVTESTPAKENEKATTATTSKVTESTPAKENEKETTATTSKVTGSMSSKQNPTVSSKETKEGKHNAAIVAKAASSSTTKVEGAPGDSSSSKLKCYVPPKALGDDSPLVRQILGNITDDSDDTEIDATGSDLGNSTGGSTLGDGTVNLDQAKGSVRRLFKAFSKDTTARGAGHTKRPGFFRKKSHQPTESMVPQEEATVEAREPEWQQHAVLSFELSC